MGQRTENIFERGQAFLHKNDIEQALRLFNQVLNREPGHKKALRNKALIKISEHADDAEEFLLFAIKQHPDDDQLHQMLGSFYKSEGAHKKALEAFNKAISSNKNNALAHLGLGILYGQIFNDHEKAIHHFTKAEQAGADSPDLYFNRGCSYMIQDDMGKAESDFKKAAEKDHDKADEFLEKYF